MLKNFFRRKKNDENSVDISVDLSADYDNLKLSQSRISSHISLDFGVLFVVMSLLLLGTVMVYSASISLSDAPKFHVTPDHFLIRHLKSMLFAIVVAGFVFSIPMSIWNKVAPYLFVAGIVLLILVLIPGIGKVVNGSRRWIPLGGFNLQVTELVKVAVLLYAANFTVRKQYYMHSLKRGLSPMTIALMIVAFLVMMEPDLGALIMIMVISFGVLFLGGLNKKFFLLTIPLVGLLVGALIYCSPWRWARIVAYLDPWSNALGKGYQLSHSLIAFGRGEVTGVGLGDAIEKQHYLPEAHTDFIMAIIGEELGFVGVCLVLFLFVWLIWRCCEISKKAIALSQIFSGLIVQGVAIWLAFQAFFNVGVASGLLPTKGLTLPFISYGGSALLSSLIAVAFVLRVDYENKVILRGGV